MVWKPWYHSCCRLLYTRGWMVHPDHMHVWLNAARFDSPISLHAICHGIWSCHSSWKAVAVAFLTVSWVLRQICHTTACSQFLVQDGACENDPSSVFRIVPNSLYVLYGVAGTCWIGTAWSAKALQTRILTSPSLSNRVSHELWPTLPTLIEDYPKIKFSHDRFQPLLSGHLFFWYLLRLLIGASTCMLLCLYC